MRAGMRAYLDAFNKHLIANQLLLHGRIAGHARAAHWGRIVNVISTSVYGADPQPRRLQHHPRRGGQLGQTPSRELGGDGITVNNVLPGYTRTQRLDQIWADRSAASGKPQDEIANRRCLACRWAVSLRPARSAGVIAFPAPDAAAYVNGQSHAVDGGRMQSI